MVDDDPLPDDLGRMVTDIGLVQRVLDVGTGRGEVSEVHDGHEIEAVIDLADVVPGGQGEQLRDPRSSASASRYPCFASGEAPAAHRSDDLAEHDTAPRPRRMRRDSARPQALRGGPGRRPSHHP